MVCRIKTAILLSAAFFAVLTAVAAGAEGREVSESRQDSETATLKSELRSREQDLDRSVGELARLGTELEESQERVEEARARQRELGRRVRELNEKLEGQKEASARSRSLLEDRVRVAYKGDDLQGLLLLLEGLFAGGNEPANASTTLQATRLLTESSRSIQYYKDTKQSLRSTIRQVERSRAEYREFGEKSEGLVKDLKGRESALEDLIEKMGLRRDLVEERIARLRAEEEAGALKRPPATSRGDKAVTRDHADRDYRENQDKSGLPEEEEREQNREQNREREIQIAREDIVAQPVGPIPYEEYVRLYKESAERYGFAEDWYVLAAVGKIESNHGENMGPSSAGAMGPMQFLPSTWSSYGVDGDGDGETNIMDPADAIPAAAAYLKAGGAPDDWYAALFAYNRAGWYVEEVLAIAESYRRVHGDETVGPYLEPAPTPNVETSPRPEPATQQEDVPDGGEDLREEHPAKEPTPTPEEEPQPTDDGVGIDKGPQPAKDGPDTNGEPVREPEDPAAANGTTTQQYQY